MRKKNPNDVIDDFKRLAGASLATWTQMCGQITGNDLRKNASVDAFLNVAIGWESFLSDWHIAAINRDSSAFVSDLQQRVEQSVTGRWPGLKGKLNLSIPKHPSLDLITEVLDPEGGNLSFAGKAKWRERAQRELCDPYRTAVLSLGDSDYKLVTASVAIRDCLAHRSQKASNVMNEALGRLATRDAALRRGQQRVQPSGIGAYLYAQTGSGRRVELYHQRLDAVAEALRV
jgi:hypothetical protein